MLEAILRGHRLSCRRLHVAAFALLQRARADRGTFRFRCDLLTAFDVVEDARIGDAGNGATPLTYFEFGTLAALWLFARARLDARVLEVGLGGRLDAVNDPR